MLLQFQVFRSHKYLTSWKATWAGETWTRRLHMYTAKQNARIILDLHVCNSL